MNQVRSITTLSGTKLSVWGRHSGPHYDLSIDLDGEEYDEDNPEHVKYARWLTHPKDENDCKTKMTKIQSEISAGEDISVTKE